MNRVKLKEIAKIDVSNVDKKSRDGEKSVKLCNFVDVYKNWRITSDLEPTFMTATAPQRHIDRFTIHKGQVAITKDSETRDDIGLSTCIAEDIPNTLLGYHCVLISPNEEVLSGEYLNLVLQSEYAHKYFELNASGSGQRYTLTNDTVENMPIPIVDLEYQRKLGDVFADIDRIIKTNNKIIETSEKLMREIYDYWFVQFDFPDKNGRPYKSSGGEMVYEKTLKREIPKGWSTKKLGNICKVSLGGTPSRSINEYWEDGDIDWLSSGEIANFPIVESIERITHKGLENSAAKLLKAGSVMISITGNIRVSVLAINASANQSVVGIEESEFVKNTYLYQYLSSLVPEYESKMTGAVQKHINKDIVAETLLTLPHKEILDSFEHAANPILKSIILLAIENKKLASLRDWLLPMLMNGQIKVSD